MIYVGMGLALFGGWGRWDGMLVGVVFLGAGVAGGVVMPCQGREECRGLIAGQLPALLPSLCRVFFWIPWLFLPQFYSPVQSLRLHGISFGNSGFLLFSLMS